MTKLEEQVLNFFCILEIALGFWMVSSPLGQENVIKIINIYSPMWLLGLVFILGGGIKLLSKKRRMWLYILLVSIPLIFFGLVFVQVSAKLNVFASSAIVYNFIGIYSAIYAGQVYRKKGTTSSILIKRLE